MAFPYGCFCLPLGLFSPSSHLLKFLLLPQHLAVIHCCFLLLQGFIPHYMLLFLISLLHILCNPKHHHILLQPTMGDHIICILVVYLYHCKVSLLLQFPRVILASKNWSFFSLDFLWFFWKQFFILQMV